MRMIGRLTTLLLLGTGVVAAVVGVKSIPDVQRYLRIRSM